MFAIPNNTYAQAYRFVGDRYEENGGSDPEMPSQLTLFLRLSQLMPAGISHCCGKEFEPTSTQPSTSTTISVCCGKEFEPLTLVEC